MVSNIQLINESFERRYLKEEKCDKEKVVKNESLTEDLNRTVDKPAYINKGKVMVLSDDTSFEDAMDKYFDDDSYYNGDYQGFAIVTFSSPKTIKSASYGGLLYLDNIVRIEIMDFNPRFYYAPDESVSSLYADLARDLRKRYSNAEVIYTGNEDNLKGSWDDLYWGPEEIDDGETNESLKKKIKECLSRLNEAEMSDEDKKDSAILWDIYNKTQKRANAKLTPEEKSVLAKYGLTRDKNKNIGITNDDILPGYPLVSRRIGHNAVLNGNDKINLADRARKINNRGIGYENDVALSSRHRLGNGFRFSHPEIDNHREYRDEKTGEWKKIKDKGLLDRERRSQIVNMSSDVEDMKHALKQRNSAKSQLDNNDTKFDAKRDAIQKAYERELAWNEERRQEASNWAKDDLDASNDKINSILNRKKKNESFNNWLHSDVRKSRKVFKNESFVRNLNGQLINYEDAVNYMDDEIREKLHSELYPCTDQEFFTAYEKEHAAVFGEDDWEFSKENPVI